MSDVHTESPIETVERLAALARIEIPTERKETLAAEFGGILAYIAKLDELAIPNDAAPAKPALRNVFREDEMPNPTGEWTETLVTAFPSKSGNALSVKKIISHD